MRRLIRAELRKTRTVWSTWVVVGITAVVVGLVSSVVAFAPRDHELLSIIRGSSTWFDLVLREMSIAELFALVLGTIVVTGEYRHKTITPTYLAEPRRGRVVASKLIVSAGWGAVVCVAAGAVSLAFAMSLVGSGLGTRSMVLTGFRHIFPGVLFASVLFALYGAGLGAMLKNQVVAVVVGFGMTAIVEPIITATLPSVGRWLPDEAARALESVTANIGGGPGGGPFAAGLTNLVTWWEGALALVAYGVVLALVASVTTIRADVT